jgi:hypothetical protein
MLWLSAVAALAAPGDGGHVLSVTGEIVALTALPFLAGGATGMSIAAARGPAEYAESPFVELGYVGVGLAGVGVPLTIVGAELEASADRAAGGSPTSHGDVAAWALFGASVATLAVGLPVASSLVDNNPIAAPIVVGSAGLASTTLWLCAVGLGAGYRGSLQDAAPVALTVVPTGHGLALAGRF